MNTAEAVTKGSVTVPTVTDEGAVQSGSGVGAVEAVEVVVIVVVVVVVVVMVVVVVDVVVKQILNGVKKNTLSKYTVVGDPMVERRTEMALPM